MKKILFLFLVTSYIITAQNNIKSDTINELEEVLITYQANKLTPVTFQDIEQSAIKSKSIGQEPSLLLGTTPSITSYSDGGYSQGYSYFRIRGMDQTRVNITLDGVPLNDPVDHGVFLSNYVDILNSVSKIQIQRGVGTSKNGTANYAGSIEMFSAELHKAKKFEFGLGSGSFNTMRMFGAFQSGLSTGKISGKNCEYNFKKALYVRISKMKSNGYKQHSSNDAQSLFISGGLFFNKSNWKLHILSGSQKNGLAWMGTLEEDIKSDRTNNGNSEFEKDDFSQTTMQIKNTVFLNNYNTIESSIYYTRSHGWWNFDYPNYATNYYNDPYYQDYASTIDDISTNSLASNLIGFFSNYKITKKHVKLTTGIHGNTYKNDFTEINTGWNYQYQNTKYKNEISAFQKIELQLNKLLFFTDMQYRYTTFDYVGEVPLSKTSWAFFNPKIGLSYQLSDKMIIYGSVGKTGREPTKYDMFEGNDVLAYIAKIDTITNAYIQPELNTNPEKVLDYEIGIRHQANNLQVNLNYYYLDFQNERVLIGEYSTSGFMETQSVNNSIRMGLELHSQWRINNQFTLINNSSYNYSHIQEQNKEFSPILTPPLIVNQEIRYIYTQSLSFGVSIRYQDKAYLNFENNELLNNYVVLNGRINYNLDKFDLSIIFNNITDKYYFNNGSIIDIRDEENGNLINRERFYFVASPRNYHIAIKYVF